jgi:hypothetical protein
MARLRRMYARLLFVVVGISGPVLTHFAAFGRFFLPTVVFASRLGFPGGCGYTHAA